MEHLQSEWDARERSLMKRWWTINEGEDENPLQNNYSRFPLRGVSQGSSIAIEDMEFGEFGFVVKPTAKMHNRLRKLAESPTGHRALRGRRVTGGEISKSKTGGITLPSNWKQSQQPWITTITT